MSADILHRRGAEDAEDAEDAGQSKKNIEKSFSCSANLCASSVNGPRI